MPKSRNYLERASLALTLSQIAELELLLKGLLNDDCRYLNRSELSSVSDWKRSATSLGSYPISLAVPCSDATNWRRGERIVLRDPEAAPVAILTVEDRWKGTNRGTGATGFEEEREFVSGPVAVIELPGRCVYEELRVAEGPAADGTSHSLAYFTDGILHPREMDALRRQSGNGRLELFALGSWQYVDSSEALRIRCLQSALKHWQGPSKLNLVPWPREFARARSVAVWTRMAELLGCRELAWHEQAGRHGMSAEFETEQPYWTESDELFAPPGAGIEIPANLSPALEQCRSDLASSNSLEYAFDEVDAELSRRFASKGRGGLTVLLTGLSGAGKSTLARSLATYISLRDPRPLTLLDGDVVRRHLSSELGFSKEHRDINVRRIGFVAAEITKNGGIALCAPIAPYEKTRRFVRHLVEKEGAFVEVHVATTLERCESRDRKGLYERARRGEIRQFTGIDDPYEVPSSPEVRIETHDRTPNESLMELVEELQALGVISA